MKQAVPLPVGRAVSAFARLALVCAFTLSLAASTATRASAKDVAA